MKNLNLLYNKIYYSELGSDDWKYALKACNEVLFGATFDPENDYIPPIPGTTSIRLQTIYPGMILGAGNPHGASFDEDDKSQTNNNREEKAKDIEIKMGFSFDYVSGQPYIPGSSVKGALRSCFTKYSEIIAQLTDCDKDFVTETLVPEIFEGEDVFLDAVVCRGGKDGKLIGEDYITPHKYKTKAPDPIRIIKIIPEVAFEFRFILKNSASISATAKLKLFEIMLTLFGTGAKTNVGYGGLCVFDKQKAGYLPTSPAKVSDINQRAKQLKTEAEAARNNRNNNGNRNNGHTGHNNRR